ncbi:MAG: serine--tRNA ligase [Parcubacteria group bacterium]|nr:serine--tRNA ligase [Parcubacteria group bacterium]
MLDIKFIRDHPETVRVGLRKRNITADIDRLLEWDAKARELQSQLENLRAEQKKQSRVEQSGSDELKKRKSKIQALDRAYTAAAQHVKELLTLLPNLPLDGVTVGEDASANRTIREVGIKPSFPFQPRDYLTIAERLDLIDMKRAGTVAGSRFGYLKHGAALLEFALIEFAFDRLTAKGFIPVVPPVLIKEETMRAMGYIDSQEDLEERYYLEKDKLFLVGTSEQSIGPMHSGEVFLASDLPRRYVGFSTCFRREAGSYGKDTQGILRVHQFDKVEMVVFSKPEESTKEHAFMLSIEEEFMQALGIPYRVVELCTGDLSRPSAATYDIEAWLPGQNGGKGEYRETHSTSNTTDFQARRLNIRYRTARGETACVHMGNGTAFAIGRTLIALIENYQTKEGEIEIPHVLRKYLPFAKIPAPTQHT